LDLNNKVVPDLDAIISDKELLKGDIEELKLKLLTILFNVVV
jgi:hypothetical protein